MLLHNFNPTFIASFNIVNIELRNLKSFKIDLALHQVFFVLYEPLVINGAHTPGVKFLFKKFTGPGPVSIWNLMVLKNVLLVLNIGMKEIKLVEHEINLLVIG